MKKYSIKNLNKIKKQTSNFISQVSNIENPTSNTAITLIALIITIIVLLILAGITLNMVIGKNGIMTKTNDAKEYTNEKSALEEVKLKILEIQANKEYEKITLKDVFKGFEEANNFDIIQVLKATALNTKGIVWTDNIEKIYVISNNYPNYIVEIDDNLNCRIVKLADIQIRLESIEISQEPNKKDYYVGESFVSEGMKVIAHYSNGESKEITNYTYNSEILDVKNNEIEIKYEEKGIIKVAIQKINVSYKPYKIAVNEITTTGFKINLNLTEEESKNIKEIKYYVNSTKEGTNYQTSSIVTGLTDYSKSYVWTTVTYNSGETQTSSNYQIVYTAHNHTDSCYSETITSRTYYACKYSASKYSASYKTTKARIMCENCNSKGAKRHVGYVGSINSYFYDESQDLNYDTADCHVSNCYAFCSLNDDGDWTEKEYTIYPKYCPKCEDNIYDSDNSANTTFGKCCHYLTEEYLSCGKSEQGSIYDYNF